MSGPLSKRQQARNEKVLQDLVQNTPGNNVCADCGARNPGESRPLRVFHSFVEGLITDVLVLDMQLGHHGV
jgi:hypothetical protein